MGKSYECLGSHTSKCQKLSKNSSLCDARVHEFLLQQAHGLWPLFLLHASSWSYEHVLTQGPICGHRASTAGGSFWETFLT